MSLKLMLALALAAAPLAAVAQEAPRPAMRGERPVCAATSDATLPPALAAWSSRSDLAAAGKASDLTKASLPVGKAVNGQLKKTPDVRFPVLPEKPGGSVSFGGLYALSVMEAGTYQISLGAGAWIDVLDGKAVLQSSAHAPGPTCTTLRKTVQFPLQAGKRYTVQLSGNGDPVLPIMVTRVAG